MQRTRCCRSMGPQVCPSVRGVRCLWSFTPPARPFASERSRTWVRWSGCRSPLRAAMMRSSPLPGPARVHQGARETAGGTSRGERRTGPDPGGRLGASARGSWVARRARSSELNSTFPGLTPSVSQQTRTTMPPTHAGPFRRLGEEVGDVGCIAEGPQSRARRGKQLVRASSAESGASRGATLQEREVVGSRRWVVGRA